MEQPKFPSKKQKRSAINAAKKLLDDREINKDYNSFAKEGLSFCVDILKESIKNPKNDYFKPTEENELDKFTEIYQAQIKPVEKLKTERGRAIAILCIDWLNGEKTQFLNIKL